MVKIGHKFVKNETFMGEGAAATYLFQVGLKLGNYVQVQLRKILYNVHISYQKDRGSYLLSMGFNTLYIQKTPRAKTTYYQEEDLPNLIVQLHQSLTKGAEVRYKGLFQAD